VLLLGTGEFRCAAICQAIRAKAIITSSSDEKLARALELGADETINYKRSPIGKKVYELTQRQGVDQVVEVGAGTWKIFALGRCRRRTHS